MTDPLEEEVEQLYIKGRSAGTKKRRKSGQAGEEKG
jgi:hypothetical protein